MFRHSPTFGRGLACLVATLAWIGLGYGYAAWDGTLPDEFRAMSGRQKAAFLAWLAIALAGLYFAATRMAGEASRWGHGGDS